MLTTTLGDLTRRSSDVEQTKDATSADVNVSQQIANTTGTEAEVSPFARGPNGDIGR